MTITELNTARYHGINLTDLQLLLLLAEHGPIDMSDLATRLGLTKSAITVVARKLVAKHLIRRIRDDLPDGDRRWVYLDLCELGRVRVHQITGKMPDASTKPLRIDCGSGHDYGACPDCSLGHGFSIPLTPAAH